MQKKLWHNPKGFIIMIGCVISRWFNGGYHIKACQKYFGTSSIQGF